MQSIRTVALSLCLVGQAALASECPFVIGQDIEPISLEIFADKIQSVPTEKGEFEKSVDFTKRRDKAIAEVFDDVLIVETETDRSQLVYNADIETFTFNNYFLSNSRYGPASSTLRKLYGLDQNSPLDSSQFISHRILTDEKIVGKYQANSALGVQTDVIELEVTTFSIFSNLVEDPKAETILQKADALNLNRYSGYQPDQFSKGVGSISSAHPKPHFTLPYPIDQAKHFSETVRTVTAVDLREPFVLKDARAVGPTTEVPLDRDISNYAIRAEVACSAVVDDTDRVVKILVPMTDFIEYDLNGTIVPPLTEQDLKTEAERVAREKEHRERVLNVDSFHLPTAIAYINASKLSASAKEVIITAMRQAADNPSLLSAILEKTISLLEL